MVSTNEAEVTVDENRLAQVFINLLDNAIKFSPNNSLVTISTCCLEDGWRQVSVVDNGRGIPVEKQQYVFERYRKMETADHTRHGASGLVLAICKAIVEEHSGKIEVESEPGKGSCFRVLLPPPESAGAVA